MKHGHSLSLHCYQDIDVPAGVKKVDARQTLPFEEFFVFENSPSAFTNIFRYKLIAETGGWWIDTDVLCLMELVLQRTYPRESQRVGDTI